ncbi:MAG: DEAD/DEAH box helicase [Bacteroides sp.]
MAFEVLAPFDLGGWVCEDVHPILAVLSNMVSRGMPTKASPWLEGKLAELVGQPVQDADDAESDSLDFSALASVKKLTPLQVLLLRWVPIAVARLQKVVLEALICGKLSLDAKSWKVAVKEGDVPCAALAFEELREMFNHLAALSADYENLRFPEVELTVINQSFTDSPLHLGHCTVYSEISPAEAALQYDLVVDIAIREYCNAEQVVFSEFQHVRNECYFNVRSSKEVYADRVFYTTSRIDYRHLTRRNAQGGYDTIAETAGHLRYFLQLLFRKRDFRDGQLPILNRALQLQPVIGLLPTGGGKSLTYQLAALLQPGITLVIDPLVSLMKDQNDGLKSNGIDACAVINSSQSEDEKKKNQIRIQESKALVVFLSPERLSTDYYRRSLSAMHSAGVYFAYGVIDEVHCVSEWGHDFRPSYLHLGRNLVEYVRPKKTGNRKKDQLTLFGLTATASFDVLADVERELSGDGAFPLTADATVRY